VRFQPTPLPPRPPSSPRTARRKRGRRIVSRYQEIRRHSLICAVAVAMYTEICRLIGFISRPFIHSRSFKFIPFASHLSCALAPFICVTFIDHPRHSHAEQSPTQSAISSGQAPTARPATCHTPTGHPATCHAPTGRPATCHAHTGRPATCHAHTGRPYYPLMSLM
jgi:hypothetical protein